VKIGLCLLSVASTMVLGLALPAGAAPTAAAPAPVSAATAKPALVPAHGRPSVVSVRPGSAIPAANLDGACNSLANGDGDFCLWFGPDFVGSLVDFFVSDTNLSNNTFLTPGLGLGQPVANNADSALNADTSASVLVFTGAGFSGTAGVVNPRQFGNFNPTFANNVESHSFV
jgi:hypothetical protein